MDELFRAMNSVVPEFKELFKARLDVLNVLLIQSPIGRKALAKQLGITERAARTIIETLREQDLINVSSRGVSITESGSAVAELLNRWRLDSSANAFEEKEKLLCEHLGVDYCIIVPGNSERDEKVFEYLSQGVQNILDSQLTQSKNIIAVTSGTTLAQVGKYFSPDLAKNRELLFVPTRGGLNANIGIQSNTVGGVMAENTGSQYLPLFIPENIDEQTYQLFLKQPSIQHAIETSKRADCLLLSIGNAEVMAQRRDVTPAQIETLIDKHAVGEAFGIFFDEEGEDVLRYPRIGIQLEDLERIPLVITVISGASKAEACIAYHKLTTNHGWLVCDEALANQVLNELAH
ncbi:SorC family transcriptional regulator [Aerococcaceae bacterium DSM 111020]|nr:SorC family transcriptional regulator [Aerococcaceae bacterium DSM 111020]